MIITCWFAKVVVWVASIFTPGTIGVTIWPCIFLSPASWKDNARVVKHERQHLKQWVRLWIVGFPFVYIYQYVRYGYKNTPLEIEARNAENV